MSVTAKLGYVLRQDMTDILTRSEVIKTDAVEEAFRSVPRHLFLPGRNLVTAYDRDSITIKRKHGAILSSASDPTFVARMLEQLNLTTGQKVLEIGAGTGYAAALISQIVGETGYIVTMDIDKDTADRARDHLQANGFANVKVVCGDGAYGFAEGAPFDRILLSVASQDISPAWQEQLARGGRLVLPLAIPFLHQISVAFEREEEHLISKSIHPSAFIMLRGDVSFGQPQVATQSGLTVTAHCELDGVAERIVYGIQSIPTTEVSPDIQLRGREPYSGALLWLDLHDERLCRLYAEGQATELKLIPSLFWGGGHSERWCSTIGLVDETGFAFLRRAYGRKGPYRPLILAYGQGSHLAEALQTHLKLWDEAGRPTSEDLKIRVFNTKATLNVPQSSFQVQKQHSTFVLDWPIAAT